MKSHIMDIPLFKRWLEETKTLSSSSIYAYAICVGALLKNDPNIESLQDYNDFLIKVMIKKRSSYYYSAIRHYINFKVTDSSLKKKLMAGLIKPPVRYDFKRERRYLPDEKILDVINFLSSEKHRVIALVQSLTGVRAGDIMKLKRGNIQVEEYNDKPTLKLILIGKGKKRNVIYIHDETAQKMIMNYVSNNFGEGNYYFLSKGKMKNRPGDFMDVDNLYRMNYQRYWGDLKKALNTAGIKREEFATHDFRRCFARRVWEKYKDIQKLQSLLNHNDPKVTLRYLEQSGLKNRDLHFEMQN